ncbi:MAG: hypothetical protein ACOC2L_01405 [Candidatus Sumerlaeota bacterium]
MARVPVAPRSLHPVGAQRVMIGKNITAGRASEQVHHFTGIVFQVEQLLDSLTLPVTVVARENDARLFGPIRLVDLLQQAFDFSTRRLQVYRKRRFPLVFCFALLGAIR